MDIQTNDVSFKPQFLRGKRRSIYDPELSPPATPENTDESYKVKLENEIKEWERTLQEKYLRKKNVLPQLNKQGENETLKLTEEQEFYLSQAPDFYQMIADHKEFVKTTEYYLNLRSHVVEDIEYRHKLLTSIANKAIRDIISKAIYE